MERTARHRKSENNHGAEGGGRERKQQRNGGIERSAVYRLIRQTIPCLLSCLIACCVRQKKKGWKLMLLAA